MLAPVTFDCSIRLWCEAEPGATAVFALMPARTHAQQLAMERLQVGGAEAHEAFVDATTATRYLHVAARGGLLGIEVQARVRLMQSALRADGLHRDGHGVPLGSPEALRYLLPSRYCPSDRLVPIAEREFGDLEAPFDRLTAIDAWVRRSVRAVPACGGPIDAAMQAGPARGRPGATEVLARGAGTPVDLAHLFVAMCRAARLPARYVTGVLPGEDVSGALHPWAEALVGEVWLAFEPSGRVPRRALLRLGTGRDAADAPLALAHGGFGPLWLSTSFDATGTSLSTLADRDREAEAIGCATLGSLAEATRWHQQAQAAVQRDQCDPSAGPRPARRAFR